MEYRCSHVLAEFPKPCLHGPKLEYHLLMHSIPLPMQMVFVRTSIPPWPAGGRRKLHGATCIQQLAQSNLRKATCAEQLAHVPGIGPTSLAMLCFRANRGLVCACVCVLCVLALLRLRLRVCVRVLQYVCCCRLETSHSPGHRGLPLRRL